MDDNQLEVEVTLEGRVYRGFVEDVGSHTLEVSFENKWRPQGSVEFGKIRFPPAPVDTADFRSNPRLVEVRRKDTENNISYWQKALLKKLDLDTGRAVIENIECRAKPITVSIDNIRPMNERPTLGQSTLEKVEIEIPQCLREIAAIPRIHDDFRREVLSATCKFIPRLNILRLITKNGESTRKKVDLFKFLHINHLYGQRKRASPPEEAKFSEEIEVDEKLMGLALGKKHSNIKEARKIRDIISVELIEGTLRIQIHGKTAEAVRTARDMLEYREHHTEIPRYLAEELLEDDGKTILEIVEQSGLVRIESGADDDDDENEDYPIIFVGNPPCIENAKALLDYQLKLIHRKLQKRKTVRSEAAIAINPNLIVERVPIKKELKGLAIGKNQENLKKAEKIPGIVKIEAPIQMPMIIIHAENEAAAQAARRLLEFDEDTVEVEKDSLGKIIGKGGVTIKQIEALSEGVRVRIPSKVEASDLSSSGQVIIKVSGPAHKIPATIDLIKKAASLGHL